MPPSVQVPQSPRASMVEETVRVAVRIRPLLGDKDGNDAMPIWMVDHEQNCISRKDVSPRNSAANAAEHVRGAVDNRQGQSFAVDEIYEGSDNHDIFTSFAAPLIPCAINGYSVTIFAYGQTASGKTYTMTGTKDEPGIIPRSIRDAFAYIGESVGREYLLRVSYMEIYNETIYDLLAPENQNLQINEDPQRGVYVAPLKEVIVTSPEQAMSFFELGEEHRHVAGTDYNLRSNRSHAVFQLVIESKTAVTDARPSSASPDQPDAGTRYSVLNLIDLAGSEKATSVEKRRVEGSFINKSLLTLGTIISRLSEGGKSFVPYRDSKLTRILKNSLDGNAKIAVICTMTASASSIDETVGTLMFATRAKKIKVHPQKNEMVNSKALIEQYRRKLDDLQSQLAHSLSSSQDDSSLELIEMKERKRMIEEQLHQEHVMRLALKERISHLARLILTSSTTAQRSNSICSSVVFPARRTLTLPHIATRFSSPESASISEEPVENSLNALSRAMESRDFKRELKPKEPPIAEGEQDLDAIHTAYKKLETMLFNRAYDLMDHPSMSSQCHLGLFKIIMDNDLSKSPSSADADGVSKQTALTSFLGKPISERVAQLETIINSLSISGSDTTSAPMHPTDGSLHPPTLLQERDSLLQELSENEQRLRHYDQVLTDCQSSLARLSERVNQLSQCLLPSS